jgi:uncharacterized protein (TIGR00290 family)
MKVIVSWSGGKDSCLALHKAIAKGFDVAFITTFLWETPAFWHPLEFVPLQAEAMGIRHVLTKVKEPYFEQYREAISRFVNEEHVEGIVTGDIALVDNGGRAFHQAWIDNVCKGLNIEVIKPLWGLDRLEILDELLSEGFRVVFTCVKQPWFDEKWLGRELDRESLKALLQLRDKYGMDICGERGEYHTVIVDGPFFKKAIQIAEFTRERKDSVFFMQPTKLSLEPKDE